MKNSPPLNNSVWPNGLKKDAEGYAVYYPLGTNKVNVSEITWPSGDKLLSPFVYENEKLVGFCDSEALEGDTFDIPYNNVKIKICGNPITINLEDSCDKFKVTLTKATVGPVIKKSGDDEVAADYDLKAPELTSAVGMFSNRKIKSIKLYIPKLTDGTDMFKGCELTSEVIYEILNSIPKGTGENSINVGKIPQDITEEELVNAFAEKGWKITKIEEEDLSGIVTVRYEDLTDEEKELINLSSSIIDDVCYDSDGNEMGRFDFDRLTTASNINGIQSVTEEYWKDENTLVIDNYYTFSTSDDKDGGNLNIKGNLTNFSSDLRSLKNGNYSFTTALFNTKEPFYSLLRNIKTKLSSLTSGKWMFGMGVKNFLFLQLKEGFPPESNIDLTPELVDAYIMEIVTQFPSDQLPLLIQEGIMMDCALTVDSIEYIAKNINDLTKTDITYNEETGEGYIDICAYTDMENSSSVINDLKEIEKIFDKKGWKYKINVADFNNNVMPFKVLSNYSAIDSFTPNISEEDLILLNSAYRVENNICYNENGEEIGEFDTSTLDVLSDYTLITEPILNLPVYPVDTILDITGNTYIMLGAYNKVSTGTRIALISNDNNSANLIPFIPILSRTGITDLFKNVKNFSSPLTKLTNWNFNTFPYNAERFESYLPNLKEWSNMNIYYVVMENVEGSPYKFIRNITHFKADMPSLVTQYSGNITTIQAGAFYRCDKLVSFEGKLTSLKNGMGMFNNCTSLSHFESDLSSLLLGTFMFIGCKLDIESIDNIADTISDLKDYPEDERSIMIEMIPGRSGSSIDYPIGIISIGAGFNPADYNGKYGTWDNLKAAFSAKKWKVEFTFADGSRENTTYGLRNRTSDIIYTKLEEVFPKPAKSKKEKMIEIVNNSKLPRRVKKNLLEHYESLSDYPSTEMATPYHNYTSQDGTRYYVLTHFHDSNVDYSDYDQFGTLEEAVEYYDVKPVFDASKLNLANVLKTN